MQATAVKTFRSGQTVKDAGKILLGTCALLVLLEIAFRLGAFFYLGDGEYYLFYGFSSLVGRVGVSPWTTHTGARYKFPPNSVLRGAAGQGEGTASINSHGFRGPDFQPTKPLDVFRVICLGESSTFGFRDSDTGTYPFLLQKLFQKQGLNVEVINAGFPYYNSGSILSLLKEELLDYRPDALTFYAAYNDTSWPLEVGAVGRAAIWIKGKSVVLLLASNHMSRYLFMRKIERRLSEELIPQRIPVEELERQLAPLTERYRQNVQGIIRIAKEHQVPVILIKQPMTTNSNRYASVSYEEEYQSIMTRWKAGERLLDVELWMVKHHRLLEELEKIAREENLRIVDNIQIVDRDRRRLASWVHLTEEANQRLAEALESVIKPYVSQGQPPRKQMGR